MNKLQNIYPNFIIAMDSMKQGTDTRLISSDQSKIKFMMSFIVYNNKLGDVTIELKVAENNNAIVVLSTLKRFVEQADTESKLVEEDLSVEEWINLISETMIKHNSNPDHQKLVLDFTKRKLANSDSGKLGCLSMILSFTFITSLLYFTIRY